MKNKIEKLKGFPLSLKQKEELLNIIKDVAGNNSGDNNNIVLEAFILANDEGEVNGILINNKEYKASISYNEFAVYDKDLFQYVISNYLNIKLILTEEFEESEGDTMYMGKRFTHFYINEIREDGRIDFIDGHDSIISIKNKN